MRAVVRIGERHEGRCAVQQTERGLDPVGTDGHLARIHAVGHDDRLRSGGVDPPAVLSALGDGEDRAIRGVRREGLDVSRILPDQIRARCPDRHHQLDFRLSGRRHRRIHLDIVGVRRRKAERVANRLRCLRADRRRQGQRGERERGEAGRGGSCRRHGQRLRFVTGRMGSAGRYRPRSTRRCRVRGRTAVPGRRGQAFPYRSEKLYHRSAM